MERVVTSSQASRIPTAYGDAFSGWYSIKEEPVRSFHHKLKKTQGRHRHLEAEA